MINSFRVAEKKNKTCEVQINEIIKECEIWYQDIISIIPDPNTQHAFVPYRSYEVWYWDHKKGNPPSRRIPRGRK